MIPSNKTRKIFFSIIILVFFLNDIYARAGGGNSAARGRGRLIGILISLIYLGIFAYFLKRKSKESKSILKLAQTEDEIWNVTKIEEYVKNIFIIMQEAWMKRDITLAKENVTQNLYLKYEASLNWMKKKSEINLLEEIEINEIKIIGCKDFNDNSQDSFIAYIKGKMIDSSYSEKTMKYVSNADRNKESFFDTYHFVRQEGRWLLDSIDNDVSIFDIIKIKNYKEE